MRMYARVSFTTRLKARGKMIVTQMNQIKDSRVFKKMTPFVFSTDFDYRYANPGIHSSNSL